MFIDRVKIKVRGGNGGNGCMSFRREKFVPMGGPNGGDGGHGGHVIFRASLGKQSLVDLYYLPHYEGKDGEHGRGKDQHGARGADRIIEVPVGTVVHDHESNTLMADLNQEGAELIAARGGRGGRGNSRFVTPTQRAPRFSEEGKPGDECQLMLELKTVADIGLVGYPNAGKSTLLTAISDAHPKTAPYPFTTLRPNVGVVEFPDFFRFTVADIPGLVEGAHDNIGLGHEFLRHIERCPILIYVVDTAGVDNRKPEDDLRSLQKELELHQAGLSRRVTIIAANKVDLPEAAENLEQVQQAIPEVQVFPISATNPKTVRDLLRELRRQLEQWRRENSDK